MARAMSAKQRAALRKAQLASARKRKGTGRKKIVGSAGGTARQKARINKRNAKLRKKSVGASSKKKAVLKEKVRKNSYKKGGSKHTRYNSKGGYARHQSDLYNSRGMYERNAKGKKHGRAGRAANKALAVYSTHPAVYGVSRRRAKKSRRK